MPIVPARRPSSPQELWELPLVKLLTDKSYSAKIRLVFEHLEPLTGRTRPFGSEAFTDHDLLHSARIIFRLGQVLGKEPELTQTELYLLLLAALLHDAGMWVRHDEALAMWKDAKFRDWAKDSSPQQFAFIESALKFLRTTPWARTKVERLYLQLPKPE